MVHGIDSEPTDVYWAMGPEDELLYVGISQNAFRRLRQHRQSSPWWSYADHFWVERYASRWLARKTEAFVIAMDEPLYNVARDKRAEDAAWEDAQHAIHYPSLESHEFSIGRFREVFRT